MRDVQWAIQRLKVQALRLRVSHPVQKAPRSPNVEPLPGMRPRMVTRVPSFAARACALGSGFLVACGSSPSPVLEPGDARAPDATLTDARADVAIPDPQFNDAGAPDSADGAACNVINIGILGNPGSNSSSNFQVWLTKAGTTVQRILTSASDPLTAPSLAPFNVIVLDHLPRPYTASEGAMVKAFVEAGGGLISMTGYNNTAADWYANPLIGTLGVNYSGPLIDGPVVAFVPHPITVGMSSVTFLGGYAVTTTGASNNQRTPVASLPGGNVAFAIQASAGRAFVWGDEWIEFDSEWNTLPQIKSFWVNIFGWVSPSGCPLVPPPN